MNRVSELWRFWKSRGGGLNLTWEVIDGIRNHQSIGKPATLEGHIVRLSDKIAYVNHDIDDAIRGGVMTEEDIPLRFREVLGTGIRARLNTLIHDVIIHSMDNPSIRMSPKEVEEALMDLRKFMFSNVYQNPAAQGGRGKSHQYDAAISTNIILTIWSCFHRSTTKAYGGRRQQGTGCL